MTQLALVLALGLVGLALAFVIGRLEVTRAAVTPTVKRVEGALERAALSLLRLGAVRACLLLAVPAAGLVAFSIWLTPAAAAVSPIGRAIFCCLSLLAGAASALGHARLALAFGTRASSASATAASRAGSRGLRPLIRSAAALAIFGEGLGALGIAAAFASLYAVRGGFASAGGNPALAREVVGMLPAFALGAAVMALVLSREGGVLSAAVGVGGVQAAERAAQLEHHDPRSPASLAELLGHHVGELVPRVLSSYVGGLSATVSAALLAAASTKSSDAALALSCLLLLLVVRAFGVVASACGVFATRIVEGEPAARALLRGQLSALLVSAFGLGAALFWLARADFLPLLWAGLLGLCSTALAGQLAWLRLRRSSTSSRELGEARSIGEGATIAQSTAGGLASLLPSLLLPGGALLAAERLWGETGAGSPLLLTAFAAGVLATAPFSLSVAGFGLLCGNAHGVAALARVEGDARRNASSLEQAGALGLAGASTHASLGLSTSLALGLLALGSAASAPGVAAPDATLLLAMLAGGALVFAFAGRVCRSAVLGAREVASEVERQLRGFPREHGAVSVPSDFTPSYKACVDVALQSARQPSLLEPALLLAAPFALSAALHAGGAPLPGRALAAFCASAVLAALLLALCTRVTRGTLGELRRRARTGESAGARGVALGAHSFGEIIGVPAATSAEALVCALTLTILSLAPLLG